jgi:hypothetical protein
MSGNGPVLQPPTTRIGGGGSAHAVAIGVVVVLVALVWVGWSGRPTGPPAGAPPVPSGGAAPTAVGVGSAPAGDTPGPVEPTPRLTPRPWPTGPRATLRPSAHLGDDVYALTARSVGAASGSILQVEHGHLVARLELPSSGPSMPIMLELHQLSSVGMPNSYVQLDMFDQSLDQFVIDTRTGVRVLELRVESQPKAPNAALLVRRGFNFAIQATVRQSTVELVVDISLLAKTRRPADEDHRIFPFS